MKANFRKPTNIKTRVVVFFPPKNLYLSKIQVKSAALFFVGGGESKSGDHNHRSSDPGSMKTPLEQRRKGGI